MIRLFPYPRCIPVVSMPYPNWFLLFLNEKSADTYGISIHKYPEVSVYPAVSDLRYVSFGLYPCNVGAVELAMGGCHYGCGPWWPRGYALARPTRLVVGMVLLRQHDKVAVMAGELSLSTCCWRKNGFHCVIFWCPSGMPIILRGRQQGAVEVCLKRSPLDARHRHR
jgi:hypothetical protein